MKPSALLITLVFSAQISAQTVNIPDTNFKAYLVGNSLINTNLDTEIQMSEAGTFTGAISCNNLNIYDLTGLEAFTALTSLTIQGEQITILDLSQNIALTSLNCCCNEITSLDISQNAALIELNCQHNMLTSLYLPQSSVLTALHCGYNQLPALDVSQNTALELIYCGLNQLTSLDVSQNSDLSTLFCGHNELEYLNIHNGNNTNLALFSALNNPNLTCIEVDDVTWSTANWISLDPQMFYSTDCSALGIDELSDTTKRLLKITDLMGRETEVKSNTLLIYIYNDGTTKKVFRVN